ncbi:MAG: serine hydrolase [Gemmatimonadetes bacterium]|nr:serine hydrolase [Gemmatimonadota bacterium]
MAPESGVTSANWIDPPHNRSGFLRVSELTRTETISKGDKEPIDLARSERDLSRFTFEFDGAEHSISNLIAETYTDAILVLHRGSIVFERYEGTMAPTDRHLLMSVSKSIVSTLCGVLIGHGKLRPEDAVPAHVNELAGTSWDECTVRQLLDMRTGTEWNYERDEEDIFDVSGYREHARPDLPGDTASWIRTIRNTHGHGRDFRYISLVTDVLGRVLERAGNAPLPELISREIWSKIGAEKDADIIVDTSGFPVSEGGISATLRDVGQFGQMCLDRGQVRGAEVVPAAWFEGLDRDRELIGAFAGSPEFDPHWPEAFYRNNWWVYSSDPQIYAGLGVFGQVLLIHRPTRSVIVKFSSQPTMEDPGTTALERTGLVALCESLG